ncbi:hypothetical protein BK744_03620 [Bacillus thuringiensis serovar zhaodongensis]|uniref:hypothetical protein n=1 Tax=Bacillus thuringiensis TaxID=1428 RepID=UPI000A3CF427|nr:hypothetical protein [Bacillus thuringiensis]OUB79373.1 hypothetical protein BK744_03620 [Bacillus thuringiensis serovar zhaodongensis]
MAKKFLYTTENITWFESFLKSEGFSEALGIVWKYGHEGPYHFEVRHKRLEIVEKFKDLVIHATCIKPRYREDKGFTEWHCNISLNHPFLKKIKQLGWAPLIKKERAYPKGDFNHDIFIKTYILMRHDVGMVREKTKKGVLKRARLRIHGSTNILEHINQHLHEKIGVGLKKLQTDLKVDRAKILHYQSKRDIPAILEYVGAWEALEKFNSFELGYEKNLMDKIHI